MEFGGDYSFDDFLDKGGAKSDGEVADYIAIAVSRFIQGEQ